MNKLGFLDYMSSKKGGWEYILVLDDEGAIGIHEAYPIGGGFAWTQNAVSIEGFSVEKFGEVLAELKLKYRAGLYYTTEELNDYLRDKT